MATGSGTEGGGCGACGLGNWPVAAGWTGILGSDCVEIGGMGGPDTGVGGGLTAAAGIGGSEVAIVTETDVGTVACAGWGAIVVDDAGGTSRICAVLTGLTLPVPGDTGMDGGGLSPCSSSFFSSRMSNRRLTEVIL